MALPAELTNGTVQIYRTEGDQELPYPVFGDGVSVRASAQEEAKGQLIELPGAGPGTVTFAGITSIFIGGEDENPVAMEEYHSQAGDILIFIGDTPQDALFNGTYRQIVDTVPNTGQGLDYYEILCQRRSTSTIFP